MAYGLVTYNTEQDIVLDSTNTSRIHYQYHSSGTITTGESSNTSSGNYYTKSYGSTSVTKTLMLNNNILFLRPKNYSGTVYFTGWMVEFYDSAAQQLRTNIVVKSFPGGVEFEYIIFEQTTGKSDDLSIGDYGLHIYGEDGETLLFSSNYLCSRMRAVATPGAVFAEETNGKLFVSTGYKLTRTRRFNIYNPGFALDQEEFFEYVHKYDGSSGSVVTVTDVTFAQVIPTGSGITYDYTFTAYPASIIIDAVGFTIGT